MYVLYLFVSILGWTNFNFLGSNSLLEIFLFCSSESESNLSSFDSEEVDGRGDRLLVASVFEFLGFLWNDLLKWILHLEFIFTFYLPIFLICVQGALHREVGLFLRRHSKWTYLQAKRNKIVQIGSISQSETLNLSDAVSGWAGWALAQPEFYSSVNPIPTRGADYAHHITACPSGFEKPNGISESDCEMLPICTNFKFLNLQMKSILNVA